jgi:hypothetical protein
MFLANKKIARVVSALTLCLAVITGFCVLKSPGSSASAKRLTRPAFKPNPNSNFRINFDYSKAEQPKLFTDNVKGEIEAAGQLLASFIGNDHEVTMIVVSDEKMTGAFASAAPSEWQGSEDEPVEKPLVTKGGIRFNAASLRQSDQDESSNVALTVHELFHALGFTTGSKAFASYVKNGQFTGPMAVKMNGGKPVPLSDSHFPSSFKDPVGVSPRMNNGGGGSYFSAVELGILADIGYDIPVLHNAKAPMFLNYTLDSKYADKISDGSYLLDGTGGNDVIHAGKGKFKIRGAGGDDVLISGDGDTEMQGDDDPRMPAEYRNGKDGKDIFVIRDKNHTYQIKDLGADDVILISPSTDITKEEIDEAMKDPKKFRNMPYPGGREGMFIQGVWLLEIGDFKIGIGTKDGKKPTKLDNIKIEDWSEN